MIGVNTDSINENGFVKKFGGIFYCAVKVKNLESALSLCIKYNNYLDLKVHLHNLSYKSKKPSIPDILVVKDYGKKKYKKEEDNDEMIANKLFNKILNKKHKRK